MSNIVLLCLVEGDSAVFRITVPINSDIIDMKKLVHQEGIDVAKRPILAKDIVLWKVNVALDDHNETTLNHLDINEADNGVQKLTAWDPVSKYWPTQPASSTLSVFVKLPAAVALVMTPSPQSLDLDLYPVNDLVPPIPEAAPRVVRDTAARYTGTPPGNSGEVQEAMTASGTGQLPGPDKMLKQMFPNIDIAIIQSHLQDHSDDPERTAETLLALTEQTGFPLHLDAGLPEEIDRLRLRNDVLETQISSTVHPDSGPAIIVSSSQTLRPLSLLSLDGGGYRGLALLFQLKQIMRNIPDISPSEKLYPHKYFDLIGGTSTGGLVALMLGRLAMDVDSAIRKYEELGSIIFGHDYGNFLGVVIQGAKFDATPFEKALCDWLHDEPMADSDLDSHCHCFVTTAPANLTSVITPVILRSYPDPPRSTASSRKWLIREAARATSAAPTYFPPLDLGGGYSFRDAGAFGFNNPTSLVLKEAEQILEFRGRSIGCVLSLGTGLTMLARPVGPSFMETGNEAKNKAQQLLTHAFQNAKKLIKNTNVALNRLKELKDDLVAVATNTEMTHNIVFWTSCQHVPKLIYLRLNPPGGLSTIDLADFARGADIEAITNQYLEVPEVVEQISSFAATLSVGTPLASQPHRDEEARFFPQEVLYNMKKDASLNKLSGDLAAKFSVILPKFPKRLSESSLRIQMGLAVRAASCAFDLAAQLGLLPGQPNERLGEFEMVTMSDLVHNGDTYCARISRHYLIFLISEHVQEMWQVGNCTHASTDIGRFTIYERGRYSMVHFDITNRTSTIPIISDQVLVDIRRAAGGEYKCWAENGFEWRRCTPDVAALACRVALPCAVLYLHRRDIEAWKLIESFATDLGHAMSHVISRVHAPTSFAEALAKKWMEVGSNPQTGSESLAWCVQMLNLLLRKQLGPQQLDCIIQVTDFVFGQTIIVHQIFCGPMVDEDTYRAHAGDQFSELLDSYSQTPSRPLLQNQLQALLDHHADNVALVVVQGCLALLARFNAQRILSGAVEAPEEWFRIVAADDDDMFIGAASHC